MAEKPVEVYEVCEFTQRRHKGISIWRHVWTGLLFIFAVALVGFLIASVLMFIQEAWLTGALTTVGAIADGAAMKWVTDRRSDLVREEEASYKDVERVCHPKWVEQGPAGESNQ